MTEQREKPHVTAEQLNVTLGLPAETPTLVGGGQIENFREGWAVNIIPWSDKPHYFKREPHFLFTRALCGFGGVTRWMYGEGDFKKNRCKRCLKLRGDHHDG